MSFLGRAKEIQILSELYTRKEAALITIYGRRRIGKSTLVEKFYQDKPHWHFEGLEDLSLQDQINSFLRDLSRHTNNSLHSKLRLSSWSEVFDYTTPILKGQKRKLVIFIDEYQWLASNQSKMTSLIKKYWDQFWKKENILLILCGSVASYMLKNVIRSKALYGRIDAEINLGPLEPQETISFLKGKRSLCEILDYNLVLGGVPKYWEEINYNQSFEQNISRLFLQPTGFLFQDYKKIFYSQYRKHLVYEKILTFLQQGPKTLEEISSKLHKNSGGGIKFYLENLVAAQFIDVWTPFDKNLISKLKKYKISDEYLGFYLKYIKPNQKLIQMGQYQNLFERLIKPSWNVWRGIAFESFCLKNAAFLAKIMGFADKVLGFGPVFKRGQSGFQIDLLFKRSDKTITMCEMKYHQHPIDGLVIAETEKKLKNFKINRGYTLEKALIAPNGVDTSVKKSDYFHHIIEMEQFFLT